MTDPRNDPHQEPAPPAPEKLPPIPAPTSDVAKSLLECPYCHVRFAFTWALLGKYKLRGLRCPSCRERVTIKQPWWAMFVTPFAWGIGALPGYLFIMSHPGEANTVITAFLLAFVMGNLFMLVVEKLIVVNYGYLIKPGEEET